MGDLRLICPSCGTEYQIPESALPETGREVECSACGHSWRAFPPQLQDSPPLELGTYSYNFDALPRPDIVEPPHPPLPKSDEPVATPDVAVATSEPDLIGPAEPTTPDLDIEPVPRRRRLPDSVLSILLEEVEHERQARAAEDAKTAQDEQEAILADTEWPATTVIVGTTKSEPVEDAADIAPEAALVALTQPETSGYWKGMGTAGMIVASLIAIYVLAPAMADAGILGDLLTGIRQGMDSVRSLLQGGA